MKPHSSPPRGPNWRQCLAACALALPLVALAAGNACVDVRGSDTGGIGGTGSPAHGETGGIGGTGAPARGGIGGTGAPQRGDEGNGGIGGTGAPLAELGERIGIVGTITGFASICVNGLEVHYDAATPVSMNGKAAALKDLAVGQVVSLEAQVGPRGLTTRGIAIVHAFDGPVSQRVPPGQAMQQMRVMGQPVLVTPGTRGTAMQQGLNPGDSVRVSGLPNANGTIVASRIDHAPASGEQSMAGTLADGRVHGVALTGHTERQGERTDVVVKGRWDGQQFAVRDQVANPASGFINRVNRVVIEGIVPEVDRSGKIQLGGLTIQTDRETRIEGSDTTVRRGHRVTISGRVDSGRTIRAEKIEISGAARVQPPGRQGSDKSHDRTSRDDRDDRHERRDEDRSGRGGGDRIERVEKVEVEKVEKVEKIEKIEKVEKVETVEKVERIERPDDSGRNRGSR